MSRNQSHTPGPLEYKALFEDDARGVAILEHLTQAFARPAVVKGGIDAVLETYQRDGQRRVLEFIVNQINRAHGVDVNNQEE
jgi:Ni,Fe-hydrogenase maturation factor